MRFRPSTLLLVLALGWFGQRPARGQESDGLLPAAISSTQMLEYADMLQMSEAQRFALEDLHAAYLARWQELREKEIDPWLRTKSGGNLPRAFYQKQRYLMKRITSIDNQLLETVQNIIADEQAPLLSRVRLSRQRDRIIQSEYHWWGPRPFDLSAAVARLALPREELDPVKSLLTSYESTLTTKLQKHVEASFEDLMKQFDAYARHGLGDDDLNDPAKAAQIVRIYKSVADASAPDSFDRAIEILELNRRTLASITPLLHPEAARWLRSRFLRAVYPQLDGAITAATPFDSASYRAGLSEEQRAALDAEAETYAREVEEKLEPMIDRIDAFRARYLPLGTTLDHAQEEADRVSLQRDVNVLHQDIESLWIAARKRADQISGVTRIAQGEGGDWEFGLGFDPFVPLAGERGHPALLIPQPISQEDVAAYARWLHLDKDGTHRLTEVYQRYLDCFADGYTRLCAESKAASAALIDAQGQITTDDVRRFEDAHAAVFGGMRAQDDAFFADAQSALGLEADDPDLLRVRWSRERRRCQSGVYGGMRFNLRAPGGCMESFIDLVPMLRRTQTNLEAATERLLMDYEREVTPLFQRRHDLMLQTQVMELNWRIAYLALQIGGESKRADIVAMNTRLGVDGLQRDAMDVNGKIIQCNRRTMESLLKMLDVNESERLHRAYRSAAWPRIARDPSNSGPLLTAALELSDLTRRQRTEVESLAAAYRPNYDRLQDQMIAVVEKPDSPCYQWVLPTAAQETALRERASHRQRLAYDRFEMNVRIWQKLRGVLSPDQSQRIGLQRVPPDAPDGDVDFGA